MFLEREGLLTLNESVERDASIVMYFVSVSVYFAL